MDPVDPSHAVSQPPLCACGAPAWNYGGASPDDPPRYTKPPVCIDHRLWDHSSYRAGMVEGRQRYDREQIANAEYWRLKQAEEAMDDASAPGQLPSRLQCRAARNRLLHEFKPLPNLGDWPEDVHLTLWGIHNPSADVDALRREGWAPEAIEVWQFPYRHELRELYRKRPELLAGLQQAHLRVGSPEWSSRTEGIRSQKVSPEAEAACRQQQAFIRENPELWATRHERSKLREALIDEHRQRRLENAGADLVAVFHDAELDRLTTRADLTEPVVKAVDAAVHDHLARARSAQAGVARPPTDVQVDERRRRGIFESREQFRYWVGNAVRALRAVGQNPTQPAAAAWFAKQDQGPMPDERTLKRARKTFGYPSWDALVAELQ